jgi:hypothetical protein
MFSGTEGNVVSLRHKLREDTVYWFDGCECVLCVRHFECQPQFLS